MTHTLIAFAGPRRLAEGDTASVAVAIRQAQDSGEAASIFVFDRTSSHAVDLDLRGTPAEIRARYTAIDPPRGPGRPKLGVIAREVTLLPRHWDWLAAQPGGASVALRKLVDEARHASEEKDRIRDARESAYRFMSAMAGDEPNFEEASRALFAGDRTKFGTLIEAWPQDVREHAHKLAEPGF